MLRHSSIQPIGDSGLSSPENPRPFLQMVRLIVGCNEFVVALVLPLLHWSFPRAILFGVTKIIIDSVKRVRMTWSLSHVGKEDGKGFAPFLANKYPAPSIRWVRNVVFVIAPLKHHLPNGEFSGFRFSVFGDCFLQQTPTRLAGACS